MPPPLPHRPHLRAAAPLAVALLALLALAPGVARADPAPRTSSLSWVRLPGAEGCIGSRALAIAVERRLRREVFVTPSRAAVAVEGRIERAAAPPGFRAVITVSNEAGAVLGSREIRGAGPSCAAMNEDLALVVAVMIDPEAALAPSPPRRPAAPPPAPAPATGGPGPVCAQAPAPPSWSVSLQAGGEAMLGLLPRVSGGVLIRSQIAPPRFWAFEVGGVLFPAVGATPSAVAGSFQLAEAFVSVCPLTLYGFGGALSACAGVQAGSLHAVGLGTSQDQGIFNVALEGRVRRRLVGPLVMGAGLGLLVPTLRARFSASSLGVQEEIFQMAPVGGAVDLSVGVEFP